MRHKIDADCLTCPKIANRSDFSLAKTVHASRVTKEIFPRTGVNLRRLPMPLMFTSTRGRSEIKETQQQGVDIKLRALKDVQVMAQAHDALEHGKSMRGKSAKAIEFQLRTEAMKNLIKSQQLEDIRKFQGEAVHSLWNVRAHGRLMDERTKSLLIDEDKLTQPLDTLSRELRGFEQKSSNYFLDKRYRNGTRRELLHGCRGCEYYNVKRVK